MQQKACYYFDCEIDHEIDLILKINSSYEIHHEK